MITIIFDSSHAKLNWLENYKTANKLINSIPLPEGYERENISKSSFSYWLRQLPIDKKIILYIYIMGTKNEYNPLNMPY